MRISIRLEPLLSLIDFSGKFTQLVKAGAGLAGRDAGPPRRPLLPPIAEELEPLACRLAAILKSGGTGAGEVGWAEHGESHQICT